MIDLTPLEVRQKKGDFRKGMRGYDPELVNDFLDLVADRMEELVKENMALNDSVEALEQELREFRDKESALSDALMTAQRLREDAKSHAEKEGELMLREARLAAEQARHEASRALSREEEALRQVRARRAQLVESFRRLLKKELGELEVIEEALELEAQPAGEEPARAAPAVDAAVEPAANRPGPEIPATPEAEMEAAEGAEDEDADDVQEDWLSSLVEEE